tara:strand:- start:12 stop:752 length:741 start_codon:yes stop_codon:yes gene_type:complete
MKIDFPIETQVRLRGLAENTLEFLEDRVHRWDIDLSNVKHGQDTIMTNKKRNMTRPLFYSQVGAGSPLDGVFPRLYGFETKSVVGVRSDMITGDHINPPQEFGEFYLDKYCGFYTDRDTSILDVDVLIDCLIFCMKKVKITKTLNTKLSHYTPSSQKGKGKGIVTTEKYLWLNEHHEDFKGKLTLMRSGKSITDEEMMMLFSDSPIDGYKEWQINKWGAKSYGYKFGKLEPTTQKQHSQNLFDLVA